MTSEYGTKLPQSWCSGIQVKVAAFIHFWQAVLTCVLTEYIGK